MAYQKINLYRQLLDSDLPEDAFLAHDLERYFPEPLPERYAEQMRGHRLKREIIATVVANQLVDRAGTTFAFRLGEETGALPAVLARAYAAAREVLDMRSYWDADRTARQPGLGATQLEMLIEGRRLVERSTRWLVRANPYQVSIAQTIRRFKPGAELLAAALPDALEGSDREAFDGRAAELEHAGVPAELARRAAGMQSMLALFDIVEVAAATERDPEDVLRVYFRLGSRLDLNWLRERIIELPRANRWQALARAALRDDLFNLYRELTRKVLDAGGRGADTQAAIDAWSERNEEALERALGMIAEIRASRIYDYTTLPVGAARAPQPAAGSHPHGRSARVGHDGRVAESRAACRCAARHRAYSTSITATSTAPATKNASGPVTNAACNPGNHPTKLSSGERKQMADTVTTTVTELPESRVRVQARGRARGGRAAHPAGRARAGPPDARARLPQGQGPAAGGHSPPGPRSGAR